MVQNRASEAVTRGVVNGSHPFHEHDPANVNKNIQHREALRLALGSILTPKRTYSPASHLHSHSSSGTASPAYPFSFPSSPPNVPAPPHPTASQAQGTSRSDVHPHTHYLLPHPHALSHPHSAPLAHLHPHASSRLGLPDTNEFPFPQSQSSATGSPNASPPSSAAFSNAASQPPSPYLESLPSLPPPASEAHDNTGSSRSNIPVIHAPTPVQDPVASVVVTPPSHPDEDGPASGTGTPKAKFIETLQSKSAWDALIHGSFS